MHFISLAKNAIGRGIECHAVWGEATSWRTDINITNITKWLFEVTADASAGVVHSNSPRCSCATRIFDWSLTRILKLRSSFLQGFPACRSLECPVSPSDAKKIIFRHGCFSHYAFEGTACCLLAFACDSARSVDRLHWIWWRVARRRQGCRWGGAWLGLGVFKVRICDTCVSVKGLSSPNLDGAAYSNYWSPTWWRVGLPINLISIGGAF